MSETPTDPMLARQLRLEALAKGILQTMTEGFERISFRLDALEARMGGVEVRMGGVERRISELEQHMNELKMAVTRVTNDSFVP